jgi:hypothetical protein
MAMIRRDREAAGRLMEALRNGLEGDMGDAWARLRPVTPPRSDRQEPLKATIADPLRWYT